MLDIFLGTSDVKDRAISQMKADVPERSVSHLDSIDFLVHLVVKMWTAASAKRGPLGHESCCPILSLFDHIKWKIGIQSR